MGLYEYEAIVAKCKCLFAKLLKKEDFLKLAQSKSISDIAVYLNERTHYSTVINGLNLKTIHRNKLEYYIKKTLLTDYMKMYKFTYGKERKFIHLMLAKHEFEYMLKIWRYHVGRERLSTEQRIQQNMESDYVFDDGILDIQTIYSYNSKIDMNMLKNITNVQQFLEAIKDTDYHDIFIKYLSPDVSITNYTDIETLIYNEYYVNLISGADFFKKDTREAIITAIGIQSDLHNLERIYRAKFNFNTQPEQITRHLIPIKHKISQDNMANLLNAQTPQDFLSYCNQLYYGRKIPFSDGTPISLYYSKYLYNLYKSSLFKKSSSFDVLIKYFFLKEIEIQDLINIIEGIRYEMPSEEIIRSLMGEFESNEKTEKEVY